MDTFTATQQHSHTYKDPYPFKDKVVVLVGIGNSAVDVATEVSRWAKSVYLVTRRYPNSRKSGGVVGGGWSHD
jgi:cation diffusion facilitator CzcD-associated flavoprotein CzcO